MKKIAIVYWSGTGNTKLMAEALAQGVQSAVSEAALLAPSQFSPADMANYDAVAFGCPAMGAETLEEDEFEPMFQSLEGALSGKKIALFGSYGWGDGEWMRAWYDRCRTAGALVYEQPGLMVNETPDDDGLRACRDLGRALSAW